MNISSRLNHALADALVAGAMHACGVLNAAFGVDKARLAFGQQAGNLFQHSVEELIFGDGLNNFAFAEDYAASLAAGETDIGVTRFAWAVDDTAHHGDMDGRLHFGEAFLDLVGNTDHVDFDAPAGGAGDEGYTAIAQFERAQDFVGHGNLFLRFRAQADADGVADATGEQQAEAHRGLHRARHQRAGLGNAQVQGIV